MLLEEPQLNDHKDFVNDATTDSNQLLSFLFNMVLAGFPYVLIIYLLLLASTFHGKTMSDLISIIYLIFAFYYIINFRKLYTKNRALL